MLVFKSTDFIVIHIYKYSYTNILKIGHFIGACALCIAEQVVWVTVSAAVVSANDSLKNEHTIFIFTSANTLWLLKIESVQVVSSWL